MLRRVLRASHHHSARGPALNQQSVGELAAATPACQGRPPCEEDEMAVCSIHGPRASVLQEKNPLHHTRPRRPAFSQALPGPSGGPGGGWPTRSNVGPPVEGRQARPRPGQGCRPPVATTQPAQDAAPGNSDAMRFQIDVVQPLAKIPKSALSSRNIARGRMLWCFWCFCGQPLRVLTQTFCAFWSELPQLSGRVLLLRCCCCAAAAAGTTTTQRSLAADLAPPRLSAPHPAALPGSIHRHCIKVSARSQPT